MSIEFTDERCWRLPDIEKPGQWAEVWVTLSDPAFTSCQVATGCLNQKDEWEVLWEAGGMFVPIANGVAVIAWMPKETIPAAYSKPNQTEEKIHENREDSESRDADAA